MLPQARGLVALALAGAALLTFSMTGHATALQLSRLAMNNVDLTLRRDL